MADKKTGKQRDPELDLLLEKIAKKLKEKREELGYTNYENFAFDNNIARSQYGKYEKGTEDLRLSSLLKVLKAMNISFEDFFNGL
ncbi:hypothetical protein Dfri01_68110 [Dyadobacter frigoris]|uniref:helix-turn-helix domain-containing protein n=1 Tax=Dyadobacter frigoris TaxID=2576211 RepID=UPI0024A00513|nr:helix-turn-helix transcriptional regulator [Dyadobacter frigoris]GLU57350.1 hypothetical protein Dfri01_68110 [Dyadobacter frigoris]